MSRFPDPETSRALLIGGTGCFDDPELDDLPAVAENITALHQRLTDPTTGVFTGAHCMKAPAGSSVAQVGQLISTHAQQAHDVLLVYYAGHGLVDERGRLYLTLKATQSSSLKYSAVPVDLLREDIGSSPAEARVLILDCCFAGRAIDVMTGPSGLIAGQLEVAGTYILASTTATAPSFAPRADRYTAFSAALLTALEHPTPLALDQIYAHIDRNLATRALPRPQQRATNSAGRLLLSRGASPASPVGKPSPSHDKPTAQQTVRNPPERTSDTPATTQPVTTTATSRHFPEQPTWRFTSGDDPALHEALVGALDQPHKPGGNLVYRTALNDLARLAPRRAATLLTGLTVDNAAYALHALHQRRQWCIDVVRALPSETATKILAQKPFLPGMGAQLPPR